MQIKVRKPKRPSAKKKTSKMSFGPVSTIATAPVAMGNSIQGSECLVSNTKNGVVVTGRDFMFAPVGANIATWMACGGAPLTPAAFANTSLSTFMRLYAKFRFKRIVAHYITSSPTSTAGDVMFYYQKDRSSVFLNQTSTSLLGFVLSDPSTVIGPQWTNHSALIRVTGNWKNTDYGMHDGIEEYADGELWLLKKVASTDPPGYVLFDYEIEFAGHQLQPRLLDFPIPRIIWNNVNMGVSATAVTVGAGAVNLVPRLTTLNGTASAYPSGTVAGDVFKIVIDLSNSGVGSWVNCTNADIFTARVDELTNNTVSISDGMTIYGVVASTSSNYMALFLNPTQAFNGNRSSCVAYGVGATVTYNLQCWFSYIGNVGSAAIKPNF